MWSWFHFLPICLLLAPSDPVAIVPIEPLMLDTKGNWYPYTVYKDGRIQGMSADIVRTVFKAADTSIQLNPYPCSRCMKPILKGLIAGCSNTSSSPHIPADYCLPRHSSFRAEIQLRARRDEAQPANTEQALGGQKITMTLGHEYGDSFGRRHDLIRIPVRKDYYGLFMLQRSRVDYTLTYRNTAHQLLNEHPGLEDQFQPMATVRHPELYLLFSCRHPQAEYLLERFDLGMQHILVSGKHQKIFDGWSQATDATPQFNCTHRCLAPQGANMAFVPELIDELKLPALFNLDNTQGRLKVYHTVNSKAIAAARYLHDKGLTDQPNDGYLTGLGLDVAEQAQGLLTILKG